MLDKILKERSIQKFTENSITEPEKYRLELEKVRKAGHAYDFEEYIQGVNAISVPLVPDPWGWPAAALWLVGFSRSFYGEKLEQAVDATKQAAAEIEDILKDTTVTGVTINKQG